ncbi:MAG: hypothetical protein LBI05_11480 [Planctomycetaceae bacterium]|jgi:hypothetical protein|nr:hypothetical protein [Planctomycetaceae bacterium]
MRHETAETLKELEHELFKSEEHAPVRTFLNNAPKNDGYSEDIDVLFDRIDHNAPAMRNFVNSVLDIQPR